MAILEIFRKLKFFNFSIRFENFLEMDEILQTTKVNNYINLIFYLEIKKYKKGLLFYKKLKYFLNKKEIKLCKNKIFICKQKQKVLKIHITEFKNLFKNKKIRYSRLENLPIRVSLLKKKLRKAVLNVNQKVPLVDTSLRNLNMFSEKLLKEGNQLHINLVNYVTMPIVILKKQKYLISTPKPQNILINRMSIKKKPINFFKHSKPRILKKNNISQNYDFSFKNFKPKSEKIYPYINIQKNILLKP